MRVVFLGTGASLPMPNRSLSAVGLYHSGAITLFDCGEGTQFQMQRAGLRPGKLQRVCISHLHGDHLFGLPGLLTSLQMLGRTQALEILGPPGIAELVAVIGRLAGFTLAYDLKINEIQKSQSCSNWDVGSATIQAKPLDHTCFCLGFRYSEKEKPGKFDEAAARRLGVFPGPTRAALVRGESIRQADGSIIHPEQVVGPPRQGRSLAYCVDTRPCRNAEQLSLGVDLLIHDSTFASGEKKRAEQTGHSTAAQAADIARMAGVRQLALTHISARYVEDTSSLLEECTHVFPNAFVASDLMSVKL